MCQLSRFTERSLSASIAIVLAFTAAINSASAAPPPAADCEIKACIDVYIQDGRIVIEGRKGKGPSSTTTTIPAPVPKLTPKPKVSKSPKPVVKKVLPIPAVTKSKVAPAIKKPRKKSVTKKIESSATSLADKLIESIPTSGISYQPSFSPLIKTPIFFWSDVPQLITRKVEIVGEVVNVRLRPIFIWHYGDGVVYMTREVGGAFPDGKIQHTYSKPGHYLIELVTNWRGEFTIDGVTAPIPGNLTTVSVLPISVVAAPIRFMN